MGQQFPFYIWIPLVGECIVARFSNRKFGMNWWQIWFCWNLYWLELSGDEIEKHNKSCDSKIYLRLFRPNKIPEPVRRSKAVCSIYDFDFWQKLTAYNWNFSGKRFDSWSRIENNADFVFQCTQCWHCFCSNQSDLNAFLLTIECGNAVKWINLRTPLRWWILSLMLSFHCFQPPHYSHCAKLYFRFLWFRFTLDT